MSERSSSLTDLLFHSHFEDIVDDHLNEIMQQYPNAIEVADILHRVLIEGHHLGKDVKDDGSLQGKVKRLQKSILELDTLGYEEVQPFKRVMLTRVQKRIEQLRDKAGILEKKKTRQSEEEVKQDRGNIPEQITALNLSEADFMCLSSFLLSVKNNVVPAQLQYLQEFVLRRGYTIENVGDIPSKDAKFLVNVLKNKNSMIDLFQERVDFQQILDLEDEKFQELVISNAFNVSKLLQAKLGLKQLSKQEKKFRKLVVKNGYDVFRLLQIEEVTLQELSRLEIEFRRWVICHGRNVFWLLKIGINLQQLSRLDEKVRQLLIKHPLRISDLLQAGMDLQDLSRLETELIEWIIRHTKAVSKLLQAGMDLQELPELGEESRKLIEKYYVHISNMLQTKSSIREIIKGIKH